jgi:peptide/nickel transport system permease protein
MKEMFNGDLVDYNKRSVIALIGERLPWTLLLNGVSLLMVYGIGIPLGIWGARWRGGWRDSTIAFGAFFLISLPNFFISYLFCMLLVKYVEAPVLGLSTFGTDYESWVMVILDHGWHLFAPALVLALPGIAVQSRYVRASMIETLGEEYIRSARAKGLKESIVYYKHALRNSLRPIITFIGFLLVGMIGGSVIVETIFAYPGMGRLGFEALTKRDLPTLMTINFIAAGLVIFGNLLADILYGMVDPRVRLE